MSASSSGAALPRAALALALLAAIVWFATHRSYFAAGHLEAELQGLGRWAPPAFIALYAAATVLFVPGSVMTLLGGALFGPLWGTLWNLSGAILGATLAFVVARYVAADFVAHRAGSRLKKLTAGVEAEGWRFVAFVRLVPLFPFNLLNYALGLTRIGLAEYILASAICMLPGAFAYTYLGYAGRETAAHGAGAIRDVALAIGLLAAVALAPRLVRRFKRTNAPRA
ncbi:MAG TPA: TVP38/TMEM64 family protein [Candidatus Binataceae bacterium]|nr:TVP38/TMEM64 family protein [Candidatus Binataceae bacterium]